MIPRSLLPVSVLCAAASSASAQEQRPFPMRVLGTPADGVLDLQPIRAELEALLELDAVILTDVPVPGATARDVELTRIDFDFDQVGVHVDGYPSDWDPGDLSLWKGRLRAARGTEVMLTLSSLGCYGWINDGVTTLHLTSRPADDGSWDAAPARWISAEAMARGGHDDLGPCMQEQVLGGPLATPPPAGQDPAGSQTLECQVAVETDWQLYQVWGSLAGVQNYILALIGAASDRYLEQIDVILTYPYVMFYTDPNDPWTSQDSGGDSVDLLYEFRGAWAGNIPASAHLAWFLSGASLGGGVAWLDVLCNDQYGFAVSGNINGGVTFPVTQGSNTWDFMVFCHEGGHNFGTPHTHSYCPPLDECPPSQYWGPCQDEQKCISDGTIMSYCHLCSGGMSNITTYFHATVAGVMRDEAENSCLPPWTGGGPDTLFFDDFESGDFASAGWTPSHAGRCKVKDSSAYDGVYGARLKKGGVGTAGCTVGTAETWIEAPAVSTVGYSSVEVNFAAHFRKNELNCEYVDLQWWTGSAWQSALQVEDHAWAEYSVALPAGAAENPALRIRFITNAKGKFERAEIDDVEIVGIP